ncbi:MAG: FtsX-like permease family protein [Gemmatimonadales bacterium]|nr:FtsX-like permease family protein [Gemmatimonadales bacterium]
MEAAWGVRNLRRHPLRTALSIAGIAVASAMLLDMVLLRGGLEESFADLLLVRGFQVRVSPKGTLPLDSEATIPGAADLARRLAADPDVAVVAPVVATSVYGRRQVAGRDTLVTLFGYGIDPGAQGLYQLVDGADLAAGDSLGVLVSAPSATALAARVGDTLAILGPLDPQVATAAVERRLVVRGVVQWLYDYRGQPSIGTLVPVMQRLRGGVTEAEVNGVGDLVRHFHERMVYFRQLATILGSVSLLVTVLLIGTLLTITVNERLGEIATLRALGVSRRSIVQVVLVEGAALTVVGAALGLLLGLVTARYLDRILTSFPGLPASFSFFVPRAPDIALALGVTLATGALAGLDPAWLAARAPIAATLRAEAT